MIEELRRTGNKAALSSLKFAADALKEQNEKIEALLRVARAARDVHEDAYFSEEGGPHYLVDVKYIQLLGDTLEEVEGLLK